MKINKYHRMSRYAAVVLAAAGMIMFLMGCMADYGRLKKSIEVQAAFEAYQPLADYQYYYSGTLFRPSAIIGIHPDYRLETKRWIALDPNKTEFKRLIRDIRYSGCPPVRGADMIAPNGQKVGVWFSCVEWNLFKLKDGNVLVVNWPVARKTPHQGAGMR